MFEEEEKTQENYVFEPQPPTPYIKQANQKGLVQVGFSSDVFAVPDLQMINNGTIYLSDLIGGDQIRRRSLLSGNRQLER